MAAGRRCRRCGATLDGAGAFCGSCGTRQGQASGRSAAPAPSSPPGWFRDPFGRQPYRYWNGEIWTEHVYGAEHERDLLSVDHRRDSRPNDGAWQASVGSLALSLLGLAVAFGLSFLFILPFLLLGHPGGVIAGLCLSEAGLWTGLFGTCVVSSHRYGTGKVRADLRLRFRWLDLPIAFGAAFVARCFAAAVLLPLVRVARSAGNPDKSLFDISKLGWIGWGGLVVVTCVGAPLFEELFFRGLLQGQLVERFGAGFGVAVTSVVFGAVHIANDPGVGGLLLALSVGASGIVLGTVRHLSGRLGTSMVTHALFNGFAVVVLALVGN